MADLKSNCNTVYLDLVAMIEAINKGFPLLVRQSPKEYKDFISRKNRIIAIVATVLDQLASRSAKTQISGHAFIQCTYELHQFLIQLVIAATPPAQEKLQQVHSMLTSVHQAAKELMRLMLIEAQAPKKA